ncbi:HDIG domain protein [Oxalobacteraceae bacterium IMCC9480]|nr:HDIG domain protein [Oxalobacteraceae bacterium IMCC9480]NDP60115.1 HDOD domain-containing protein [Oxalobacteraceae bacterium]
MTALRLEALIGDPRDLPSLPALVLELMATLEQANISIGQLADKIMLDQALAARTLRLANSPFYGMTARVVTIEQAITILGMSTVRMLVTAVSMTTAFGRDGDAAFDADRFWRKAIATAICAKNLAPLFDRIPATAFVAGLLHGIGELVIATRCPDDHAAILAYRTAMDCLQRDAELAVLGFQQSAVGAALLQHWRFPPAIISAVAHQDNPPPDDALAVTVHLANILAHALDIIGDIAEAVPQVNDAAWARLSLEPAALSFLLDNTRLEYNSICQVLAP